MFVPGSDEELFSGEEDLETGEREGIQAASPSDHSSDLVPTRCPEWSPTEGMSLSLGMSIGEMQSHIPVWMEAMGTRRLQRQDRAAGAAEDEDAGVVADDQGYAIEDFDEVLGEYRREGHSGFAGDVPDEEGCAIEVLGEHSHG